MVFIYSTSFVKEEAAELIFQEDPIAVVEAESANILQRGYEPIPQEPEYEPPLNNDNIYDMDQVYCPLKENDDKMDTFYYYIKNPEAENDSSESLHEPSSQLNCSVDEAGPSSCEIGMKEEGSDLKKDIPSCHAKKIGKVMTKEDEAGPSHCDMNLKKAKADKGGPDYCRIDMNEEKANEVKRIMLKIDLPVSFFPDWASELPEEEWKNFVLRKMHLKRKENFIENEDTE